MDFGGKFNTYKEDKKHTHIILLNYYYDIKKESITVMSIVFSPFDG